MTAYVILEKGRPGEEGAWHWRQGATVEALSAEAAVRKAVTDKGGTYVAIPLRSFQPLTVEVETKRTLKLVQESEGG